MFELKKIGFIKRASAWLLDAILLAVLATGFMWIISLICNFEEEADVLEQYTAERYEFQKEYMPKIAEHYGFVYTATYDDAVHNVDYEASKDGKAATVDDILAAMVEEIASFCGYTFEMHEESYLLKAPDGSAATISDLSAALGTAEGERPEMAAVFQSYAALTSAQAYGSQYQYVNTMLFMMVSVGIFLAYLILEFILPVILKNGQTVGKKVFSICLVRPDCVRITTLALFGRVVIGKFAIETMFPVLLIFLFFYGQLGLLALILLGALLLLNTILFFATKNHTPIHDILAFTVAADMKEQMIYASEEELNERKAELRKAEVQGSLSDQT